MEPLKDWYRYLDQVSRPARRDTEPDAPQEEAPWKPWKQDGMRPGAAHERGAFGTVSTEAVADEAHRDLPDRVVPPPLFPSLSGGVRLGTCMPAGRHFEDLTVNDTLQPIPEFSVPQLRPPALELVVPELPSRPGSEAGELPAPALEMAPALPETPEASALLTPAETRDRCLPEALGNLLQEVVEAAVEARLREPQPPPDDDTAADQHSGIGESKAGAAEGEAEDDEAEDDEAGRADRAPRHWDLLTQIRSRDVAQNSYKAPFQETREELVQRLLDPELTLEETARLLDVCPTTVRRYTNKGLLRCFRTPGNQRRFRLSDVFEFMEHRFADSGGDSPDDETGDDERN